MAFFQAQEADLVEKIFNGLLVLQKFDGSFIRHMIDRQTLSSKT